MAECAQSDGQTPAAENPPTFDKQLTCSICMDYYRHPRYLPTCGHTFCEHCLLKYARNIQQEGVRSSFHCPVCRGTNNLPEHEVTREWIQMFPQNTIIAEMIESLPQFSVTMKEEQIICDPCREEGDETAGFKYCIECKVELCKNCTKFHKNLKLTKEHKLVDVREISTETRSTDFFRTVGKCTKHPEKDVEIFCHTHDAILCAFCLIADHKSCEMVDIQCHKIDTTELQNHAEVLTSRMKEVVEHCNGLNTLRSQNKTNLKHKLKAIKENSKVMRDDVVELMDKFLDHVTDATKQIEIETEDRLEAGMARVTKLKELTEQNVALMDTIKQHGSEKYKFVSAHRMSEEFMETYRQISKEDENIIHFNVDVKIAGNLKELIESADEKKLIQIEMTESENSSHSLIAPMFLPLEEDTDTVLMLSRDCKRVVAGKHVVCPEFESGLITNCAVAMCSDGKAILTLTYFPSDKVYIGLFNPTDDTMQRLNLASNAHSNPQIGHTLLNPCSTHTRRQIYPSSAVQIDETHLAVSIPNNKTIQIVAINNNGTRVIEKTLTTPYTPLCIVALNNGQLAVAWNHPPAFGVIDVSGTEIRHTLYLDQDTNGRRFHPSQYLAVDEKRQHFVQLCADDKAVYCLDLKGNPVFKYTHPELSSIRGVALDKWGNINVCTYRTDGIHRLSPTGDLISVITEGVPSYPLAMCADVTGTGFWITHRLFRLLTPDDGLLPLTGVSVSHFSLGSSRIQFNSCPPVCMHP